MGERGQTEGDGKLEKSPLQFHWIKSMLTCSLTLTLSPDGGEGTDWGAGKLEKRA